MQNTKNEGALGFSRLGLRSSIIYVALGLVYFVTLLALYHDWKTGGDNFRQADWLINNARSYVRRGFTGTFFLYLSDILNLSPVTVVVSTQIALLSLIFLGAIISLGRLRDSDIFILIVLSPGFLSFEASNITSLGMKEILGLAAFAPLVLQAVRPRYRHLATLASLALYGAAAVSHEINIFIGPFLLFAILLLWSRTAFEDILGHEQADETGVTGLVKRIASAYFSVKPLSLYSLLFALAGLVGLLYTMAFSKVADAAPICAPLLAKGLDPAICGGSIDYLTHTLPQEFRLNIEAMMTYKGPVLLLSWSLAVFPIIHAFRTASGDRRIFGILLAAGLIFLPFYFVAVDWGRWIFTYVTSVFFCIAMYALTREPRWLRQPVNDKVLKWYASLSMLVGIHYIMADLQPGVLFKLPVNLAKLTILGNG